MSEYTHVYSTKNVKGLEAVDAEIFKNANSGDLCLIKNTLPNGLISIQLQNSEYTESPLENLVPIRIPNFISVVYTTVDKMVYIAEVYSNKNQYTNADLLTKLKKYLGMDYSNINLKYTSISKNIQGFHIAEIILGISATGVQRASYEMKDISLLVSGRKPRTKKISKKNKNIV